MQASVLKKVLVVATFAVPVGAFAASGNPLDPTYYIGQPAVTVSAGSNAPYVDAANPLTPSYHKGETVQFVGTASTAKSQPYVDSANPLTPSHFWRNQ
jgi:hypothetical protein